MRAADTISPPPQPGTEYHHARDQKNRTRHTSRKIHRRLYTATRLIAPGMTPEQQKISNSYGSMRDAESLVCTGFLPLFLEINKNTKVFVGSRNFPAEKLSHLLLWEEMEVVTCHFAARSFSECCSLHSQTSFNTSAGK